MFAIIDLTKGHHDHGKHTVHPHPEYCPEMRAVQDRMSVTLLTAFNGIALGQWAPCSHCTIGGAS